MKNRYLATIILSLLLIFTANCSQKAQHVEFNGQYYNPQLADNPAAFIDTLQYRSFMYFIDQTNPANGLVKDRSTSTSFSSIAAVGFAIPGWAIGAERGWISHKQASELTLNTLRFFWNSEQSPDPRSTGFKGFYYHFLTMDKGKRFRDCELSTIDTALLLAGVRFAYNYYNTDDPVDKEIRQLADSLTFRTDWDWFTFPDSGTHAEAISMGWRPERGFVNAAWTGYNEALILHILAAGSGYKGAEKAYERWLDKYDWRKPYSDIELASFPPLFGHQYSQMFIDFRDLPDSYMREKHSDYFRNAKRAAIVQHRYAIENPLEWVGYDSLTWGLTACDGPGPEFNTGTRQFRRYSARGTSGPDLIHNDDGTIAPTAAAASIDYLPNLVVPTLLNMYTKYGPEGLWGKYGFYDAFNPTIDWYNP
ncbi:Tat pathway signal protein, partial [candidate division KSB1 bacterium]|nr:Tat pathway signal protein [candidate division KSB1 bacterium]